MLLILESIEGVASETSVDKFREYFTVPVDVVFNHVPDESAHGQAALFIRFQIVGDSLEIVEVPS